MGIIPHIPPLNRRGYPMAEDSQEKPKTDTQKPSKKPKKNTKTTATLGQEETQEGSAPQRDRARAIELFDQGLKLYNEGESLNKDGKAAEAQKKFNKAEAKYRDSISADDSFSSSYHNLGVIYNNQKKNYPEAEKFFRKALELDPLYKLYVDNLISTLNTQDKKSEAIDIEREYYQTLKNLINSHTKSLKRHEALLSKEALEAFTENAQKKAQETNEIISEIQNHKRAIEDTAKDISQKHEDIKKKYENLETHALSQHYQKKADDLKDMAYGLYVNLWKIKFGFKHSAAPVEKMFIVGYSFKFLIALILTFVCAYMAGANTVPRIVTMWQQATKQAVVKQMGDPSEKQYLIPVTEGSADFSVWMNFWQFILLSLLKTAVPALLIFWTLKYLNRRLHETIHLMEEYEHRAIVLRSFPLFKTILGDADKEGRAFLTYAENVSRITTTSPTSALHSKKGDKLPVDAVNDIPKIAAAYLYPPYLLKDQNNK